MPNRDGTGPQGKGPKTGRGTGKCPEPKNDSNKEVGWGWNMKFKKIRNGFGKNKRNKEE